MKATDINKLKGDVKTSIQAWIESKVDDLFPTRLQTRIFLKRGFNNYLARADGKLNGVIDYAMLFLSDENGCIDTDVAIDMLVEMFKEMEVKNYRMGIIPISVGKGRVIAELPHNPLLDMIVGDLGKLTITADDVAELKNLIS